MQHRSSSSDKVIFSPNLHVLCLCTCTQPSQAHTNTLTHLLHAFSTAAPHTAVPACLPVCLPSFPHPHSALTGPFFFFHTQGYRMFCSFSLTHTHTHTPSPPPPPFLFLNIRLGAFTFLTPSAPVCIRRGTDDNTNCGV